MSVQTANDKIDSTQFLSLCEKARQAGPMDEALKAFLLAYAHDAFEDDIAPLSLSQLAEMALSFWDWAENKPSPHEIRASHNSANGRVIINIISDDMPFLVDSVMGEIAAAGFEVAAMMHPVVSVSRGEDGKRNANGPFSRESMIEVHLPDMAAGKLAALLGQIEIALADVRAAVHDFSAMKAKLASATKELAGANTKANNEDIAEALAFLDWVAADNFVFLGARSYSYPLANDHSLAAGEPIILTEQNLGILRDGTRSVLRRQSEPSVLSPRVRAYLEEPLPIVVAKSNLVARVHRRSVMDYIGIKSYDGAGHVIGETRFVGLFTAEAYDRMASEVPLVRAKIAAVAARADLGGSGHNAKVLRNILENYPRDELFQIDNDDLLRIATGIQHLVDRPRTGVFVRRDRFDRFMSVLVYVPRDRYNPTVRAKIGTLLANRFGGRLSAFYPQFGVSALARVHYIIGVTPNEHPEPDIDVLEAEINALTRTWEDGINAAALAKNISLENGVPNFPLAYQEAFDGKEALADLAALAPLAQSEALGVRAYQIYHQDQNSQGIGLKIYAPKEPVALSVLMPILTSLGLFVTAEHPYHVGDYWIQDLQINVLNQATPIDFDAIKAPLEEATKAIYLGQCDIDGFNRLIVLMGISWRQACLLRALCRWRGQTGLDPSQNVQEQALYDYPQIARLLLDLFYARFGLEQAKDQRQKLDGINQEIEAALVAVPSLDADRVLRRLQSAINAIQRTNYFRPANDGPVNDLNGNRPVMSFKIATRELDFVPEPKPYREIWVFGAEVEGVHLRFGPVARGGLRWSDRRDDFRTEVLGLVKAQQVKNAVIVPVGAKGGFFPKRLVAGLGRDEMMAVGISAYKAFLRGLLDLTDNIGAYGEIIAPPNVVRHDGDDPYLVVAADKGTATFSDTANAIAAEYDHWLGDGFASGGSKGYDHKKMGITARGGWEAVKRHFREMAMDSQSQDIKVIGVGDMSGDVFGNGMLLSRHICLQAAFDHRDIFIDPNPDPETSSIERQRMFALPRSSWADYNAALISKGGGIFSRSLKSIPLSDEMKALSGLSADAVTPTDLMSALLKAPCDLLWFGGIGTYIKAETEAHSDVGDKANDLIRINGNQLKAKVIGEGANLGVTQKGRIEAALSGVRINNDAIDNSAGVDSSDHEVNIKILLGGLVRSGQMSQEGRDDLLVSMTDDVAHHVLAHNIDQTLSLSLQEARAKDDLESHLRLMDSLEFQGRLNRAVEFLPDRATALARANGPNGKGLVRPELAVLSAYAKIALFDGLIASNGPDDPGFESVLVGYFPKGCHQFEAAMGGHRLKRDIIATVLCNRMIDLCGASLMDHIRDHAQLDVGAVAKGFAAARQIFNLDGLIKAIKAQDLKIPASAQHALIFSAVNRLEKHGFFLAEILSRPDGQHMGLDQLVGTYKAAIGQIMPQAQAYLSAFDKAILGQKINNWTGLGATEVLTEPLANLLAADNGLAAAQLASGMAWPALPVFGLYQAVGEAVQLDELAHAGQILAKASSLDGSGFGGVGNDHWSRQAARRLLDELAADQARLTQGLMHHITNVFGMPEDPLACDMKWAGKMLESWQTAHETQLSASEAALADLASSGAWSFAKLSIAASQIKALANAIGLVPLSHG